MPDDDAPTTQRNRARVFVEFWNYTLSMRHVDSEPLTDRSTLGPVLAEAAGRCIASQSLSQDEREREPRSPSPQTQPGRGGWVSGGFGVA